MEEKGLTVADALALRNGGSDNNNGGFGDGNAWWVIILILFLGMGGRGWGGYGNNGGNDCGGVNTVVVPTNGFGSFGGGYNACCTPVTLQGMTDAFNFNQLDNGQRGLERGLCDGFYSVNLGITNLGTQLQQGFCATDRANLQGFNGIQSALCQGFNGINSAITQTNYNMKDCCCETKQAITENRFNTQTGFNSLSNQLASCCCDLGRGQENIKYALAQQTCDIISNADKNTDRIINHLVQSEMDKLRTELQSAQFQLSQNSQTRALIDQLQPCPKPAYLTCSPYQTYPISNVGFGFNSGCGNCC
jgi:hypothetical protein